jgi:AcrR family transcriptional regulator
VSEPSPDRRSEPVRGEAAVKRALLEAAADLIAEVGPTTLSLREVARRAGVNHGQIHHYFGSKRALLVETMRLLARDHQANMLEISGGDPVPPALSLAEDPRYWRALCHVVLEGDLELARVEIDEGVSVPRGALAALRARRGGEGDDEDFRVRFAALAALQLGWVALEDFVVMQAELEDMDREELRRRVRRVIASLLSG